MSDTADRLNSASIMPGVVRPGLAHVEDAGALPVIVDAISSLDVGARATMLGRLLPSVGPLALAVVARGAFAKYVPYARSVSVSVSHDDAALATPDQIAEVVQYVRQSNPKCFQRVWLYDLSHSIVAR